MLCLLSLLLASPLLMNAAAPNPTSLSASTPSLTMPGTVRFCAGGGANMTVDLKYYWDGVPYETDYGVTFGADGCVDNYYDSDSFAGSYTFTGIRNSNNGPNGAWTNISTPLTLYPRPAPPSVSYFYPDQSTINRGDGTYLNWDGENVSSAKINGQYVSPSGWMWVTPTATTTYTLTVYNSSGDSTTATTRITVNSMVDNAGFISQTTLPSPLEAGRTYTVSVTMRNSGTTTWSESQSYRLGSQNPASNTTWGLSRVTLATGESVVPGANKTFTFAITAPSTPNTYNFQWRMVREGVGWFGASTLNQSTPSVYPQPTSMSFSPTSQNAGNGDYWLTVGNGANLWLSLQYEWSGNPGNVVTVARWEKQLDSQGKVKVTVNHNDGTGTYTYRAIKNADASTWVMLSPPVSLTINPPIPYPNTLTISPASMVPPGTFTMSAGNMGSVTADSRYLLNGLGPEYTYGWPVFSWASNESAGQLAQAPLFASRCTAIGDYAYTGLRDSLLPAIPWADQSAAISIRCPNPPDLAIVPNTIGPVVAGTTTTYSITGTRLCGPLTIWSDAAGITFPSYSPDPWYDGSPVTATVSLATDVPAGLQPFHISTPCGTASGSLNVMVNNAQFVSQSVPTVMVPGGLYAVSVTLTNTGTTTWNAAGNYQLGSQNPANNTTWGPSRVVLAAGESVPPGASKTFSFNVTAPTTPGTYNFLWQMAQNGVWFGDVSANLVIGVALPPSLATITPSSGKQGQHDFEIVIAGSNLTGATLSVPSSSHVAFSISPPPTVTATQISALVAIANDAPVQSVPITVKTLGGSQIVNFSVTAVNPQGQPVVTSISPTSMLTGATQTFTLTGSNLTQAMVTTDSTLAISTVSNVSDTQLQVTVVANGTPTGTYLFTVTVPQYGITNVIFRVLDAASKPTIDSVAPATPNAGGVYYFHLTGNNLANADIHADNSGIHILRGMVQLQSVSQAPEGYEIVVGLLTVDPNVAPGIAHIIASNAAGDSSVEIQVGPLTSAQGIQIQAGKLTSRNTSFDKQVRNNTPIILDNYGSCSGACAPTEIDVASFQIGLPFIQCGNSWFDTSCLHNIKIGHPINLTVGFIGIRVRIYTSLGFQLACNSISDVQVCYCTPEPCALSVNMTIGFITPTSKSLQFTRPLLGFLSSAPEDCSQPGVCTDTINVVSLPQDTQICAGLVNMTFLGGFSFSPGATCVNVTPGLNATLTATPQTIIEGSSTTLSWTVSTSQGNPIRISHVHITDDVNDPPYDCGDELLDFTPCDLSQSVPLRPSGTTIYTADFRGTAGILPDFFPSHDSPAQVAAAQARVRVNVADPSQTTFISPSIISLNSGGTRQLIPTDAQGNSLAQFPQGTTFSTLTLAATVQNGQDTAFVNQTGLVTGNSTPGVVLAAAYLPDHTFLKNYKTQEKPFVQVGPMRLYLRFLPDAISFMKGSFPGAGLALSDADVASIEAAVVARVQSLFSAANVVVMLSQPPGWGTPDAGSDAVVTMDISALKDSNGNFSPPRRFSDTETVTVGDAVVNDLDFLPAIFGGDALAPRGVFINQLPLINGSGLRASNDLIANGIANVAAHEIGHVLGLVPNSNSQSQVTQNGDNRFAGVAFDGDANHHATAGIMQKVFSGFATDGATPLVLSTQLSFRENETAYLTAILPR
ncbi:MAG: hypothetical protein LAO21_03675 [Acidobacteriia bacterium]|nr:hypothetical protein [Terriglobia bacterium]